MTTPGPFPSSLPPPAAGAGWEPSSAELSLELSGELSAELVLQRDLGDAASLCVDAARRALQADRAYCRVLEPDGQSAKLWATAGAAGGEDGPGGPPSLAGLSAEVLVRGQSMAVANAGEAGDGEDHFAPAVDDPAGGAAVHWLGVPVPGPRSRPIAVLVAVRSADAAPFDEWDVARMRLIAHIAAPTMAVLAEERHQDQSVYREQLARGRPLHLFRQRAIEEHSSGGWQQGDPLGLGAPWQEWAFWLLAALLVVASALAVGIELPVRANAPAVVLEASSRGDGRLDLRVRALVPLAAGQVEAGSPARLRVREREGRVPLKVVEVGAVVATPSTAGVPLGVPDPGMQDASPYRVIDAAGSWREELGPVSAGAPATLEVVVGQERLLLSLFPGLRQVVRGR